MRVKLALCYDPTEPNLAPRILSALDEYTEDDWGGSTPDFWTTDIQRGVWSDDCEVRTLTVEISEDAIAALFKEPSVVTAKVVES